jgi:hypothetical protein
MVDFANFWAGALQLIEQSVGQVWTQQPVFLIGLALTILLAAVLVALFRRTQRRLRDLNCELTRLRDEMAEIRGKYEREVHWRKAAEEISADNTNRP